MAKKHLKRAAHYARTHHGKVTKGAKGSAMSTGVGAATYFATQYAVGHVPLLQSRWWAPAVALAVGGHFLKRKSHDAGTALCAIGGYIGGLNYAISTASGSPAATAGFDNSSAGALQEAGAMQDAGSPMPFDQNAGTSQGAPNQLTGGAGDLTDYSGAGDMEDAYGLEG